jgi:predicted PhzF superfamily epimerase YddE/YHI9
LMAAGVAGESYVAAQGTCLGRAGRVHVQKLGQDIWIGGDSVTCIEGQVLL